MDRKLLLILALLTLITATQQLHIKSASKSSRKLDLERTDEKKEPEKETLNIGLIIPYTNFGKRDFQRAINSAIQSLSKIGGGATKTGITNNTIFSAQNVHFDMMSLTPSPTGKYTQFSRIAKRWKYILWILYWIGGRLWREFVVCDLQAISYCYLRPHYTDSLPSFLLIHSIDFLLSAILHTMCHQFLKANVSAIIYLMNYEQFGRSTASAQYLLQLSGYLGIPVISWNADNSGLERTASQYTMQIQLAPSIEHQSAAMLSILERYKWHQFSIVTSQIAGHDDFVQAVREQVNVMQVIAADTSGSTCKLLSIHVSNYINLNILLLCGKFNRLFSTTQEYFKFTILNSVIISRPNDSKPDLMELVNSEARVMLLYCTTGEANDILKAAGELKITGKIWRESEYGQTLNWIVFCRRKLCLGGDTERHCQCSSASTVSGWHAGRTFRYIERIANQWNIDGVEGVRIGSAEFPGRSASCWQKFEYPAFELWRGGKITMGNGRNVMQTYCSSNTLVFRHNSNG